MLKLILITVFLICTLSAQQLPDELKLEVKEKDKVIVDVEEKSESPEKVLNIDISKQFSNKIKLENKVLQVPESEEKGIPTFYYYAITIICSVFLLVFSYRLATGLRYFKEKHVDKGKKG